jgi:hypothetical protein
MASFAELKRRQVKTHLEQSDADYPDGVGGRRSSLATTETSGTMRIRVTTKFVSTTITWLFAALVLSIPEIRRLGAISKKKRRRPRL